MEVSSLRVTLAYFSPQNNHFFAASETLNKERNKWNVRRLKELKNVSVNNNEEIIKRKII